jgi:hypothetical protein
LKCSTYDAKSWFLIYHLRLVLDRSRLALIYIYCDYRDKDKQDACSLIGELAKQLFLQSRTVPDEMWKLFDKHSTITMEQAKKIFTLLLRGFESTYICIDALDECDPHSRSALLGFLRSIDGIRIFCTSRTSIEVEATELLGPLGTRSVQIFAHEADLRRHIEVQISQDRHKKAMDEQLQKDITEALLSRSQKL